jgi:TolA-binding protein
MDIMDRDKNKEEAAVAFRVFVKDFPNSTHGLKALYNAMVLYSDVAKLDLAVETGLLLLDKYAKETPGAAKPKVMKIAVKKTAVAAVEDKTKKADKSEDVDPIERTVYLVGTYYDKISDFKNAADYFERYYEKYPKGKTADDALYNAALFREAMGLTDKAIENFGRYVKDFPTAKDTVDIQFRIGKIYQKKEDWVKAKAILQGFIEKYGKQVTTPRLIEAEYELATVLQKMDQEQAAFKEFDKILKIADGLKPGEANEKTFYYIASSRFQLLQPDYHSFMNIKLELPQSVMKQNLKIKSEKLAKLTESFTEVLKLGQGDMGIAALCRIGQMYQNFARALFDAPVPKNLNEEQREIYTAELQNLAFPVEEKAIEAFEKALLKMYELGIYNEWATTAQENLNKYKPGTYPDLPPTIYVAKEYFYQAPYLGSLKASPLAEPKAKPAAPAKTSETRADQAGPGTKEAADAPKTEMKDSGKK